MLVVKKDFNFEEFEKSLQSTKRERQIRLPTQFSRAGYWGIDVALIQLLITWARAHPEAEIKSYIEDHDPGGRAQQLSDLGFRLFGISALYLVKSLVTAQGTPIPKDEYARHCSAILKAMDEANIHSAADINSTYPRSGGRVAAQFACLHGSRFEFLRSLYHSASREDLLNRVDFSFLINSAIENDPRFAAFLRLKPEVQTHLAYLVYELFQNTNDHAYENFDDSLFPSNVRAFTIKGHSGLDSHEHLSRMESANPQFNDYLRFCSQLFSERGKTTQHFLELSIVDGGLGYAQRLTGKPLSDLTLDEEKQATVDCFKLGVSSKRAKSRGEGLDNVWKALCDLKGFIRLRTGRLCLFQTFHNRKPNDERAFSLWTKAHLEQASGTAVTIIIPCVF